MTRHSPAGTLQGIPHSAARFCLEVERFCRVTAHMDICGRSVLVAYSGGADSKALLLALHFLASRLDTSLHAAILDHMLRPEAVPEVEQARMACGRLGIPFHTARRDVAELAERSGVGLEEAGRIARLEFLEDIRQKTGCDWIAFGHHLNDLAEDALMRMIRGAGWPALGGMRAVVPERRAVRPLLLVSRAAIETFLTDLGETWFDDAMNEDTAYFRNRVRKRLLPELVRENPAYLDSVAERWLMARDDEVFFREFLENTQPEPHESGIFFSRASLEALPSSLRLRKYLAVLLSMGKGQASAEFLRNLDAVWRKNEGGKTIQFPGGKRAEIRDGGILFFHDDGR